MRVWDLNPIVLAHIQRFFFAARRAAEARPSDDLPVVASLAANLVWANSAFVSRDPAQDRARSTVAAIASTFAGNLHFEGARQNAVHEALSEIERGLWASLDPLLVKLLSDLEASGQANATPAVVDRWLWERLFPGYPWGVSQSELERAILERMSQ